MNDHTPNVPAPADAERVGDWTRDDIDERWFRRFRVHAHTISGMHETVKVAVQGEQFSDGTASRTVELRSERGDLSLTPYDAREVAAALLEAANRAEKGSRA